MFLTLLWFRQSQQITLLPGGRLTLQAEVGQMQKDLGLGDNLVSAIYPTSAIMLSSGVDQFLL